MAHSDVKGTALDPFACPDCGSFGPFHYRWCTNGDRTNWEQVWEHRWLRARLTLNRIAALHQPIEGDEPATRADASPIRCLICAHCDVMWPCETAEMFDA